MTPDPTLTDEELAGMEAVYRLDRFLGPQYVPRLIAAYRASREEVEQLRNYIKANPIRACYEEAEAERDTLQIEVERLREWILTLDPEAFFD